MADLERRWRELFDSYSELKADHEGRVARWEWASGERYDPRPLFFERHALPRGMRLTAEPPDRNGSYLYGFDASDRVVVARRFTVGMDYSQNPLLIALRGLKPVPQWSDQFLSYSEDGIQAITYTQFEPRMPVVVAFLATDGGMPVSYRSLEMAIGPQIRAKKAADVWELAFRTVGVIRQSEDYGYEDGRLVKVEARVDSTRIPSRPYEQRLSYDAGRLARVEAVHPDGTTQTAYQRAKKGESLPDLAKRVEARLVLSVPESLAAARVKGRAYCLVLIYHDRYAPPDLVVGLERDRDRLLAGHGADARHYLYVPVDPWVQVRDPDFEADYARFEQQVTMTEGWELARKMLRGVARELSRRDWAGVLDVTPEFVVYAADYEAEDIPAAIAASNEPSRVAELRARGWL